MRQIPETPLANRGIKALPSDIVEPEASVSIAVDGSIGLG